MFLEDEQGDASFAILI